MGFRDEGRGECERVFYGICSVKRDQSHSPQRCMPFLAFSCLGFPRKDIPFDALCGTFGGDCKHIICSSVGDEL